MAHPAWNIDMSAVAGYCPRCKCDKTYKDAEETHEGVLLCKHHGGTHLWNTGPLLVEDTMRNVALPGTDTNATMDALKRVDYRGDAPDEDRSSNTRRAWRPMSGGKRRATAEARKAQRKKTAAVAADVFARQLARRTSTGDTDTADVTTTTAASDSATHADAVAAVRALDTRLRQNGVDDGIAWADNDALRAKQNDELVAHVARALAAHKSSQTAAVPHGFGALLAGTLAEHLGRPYMVRGRDINTHAPGIKSAAPKIMSFDTLVNVLQPACTAHVPAVKRLLTKHAASIFKACR